MTFEWDPHKSARNEAKHGVSFAWVEESIEENGLLGSRENVNHPGQEIIAFRGRNGKIYAAAIEQRGSVVRLISAHRDRKLEKAYGP